MAYNNYWGKWKKQAGILAEFFLLKSDFFVIASLDSVKHTIIITYHQGGIKDFTSWEHTELPKYFA